MAEMAAKMQEAGATEAPAPAVVGELGAGSLAPPPALAAPATTPATPSCPRLVEATLAEAQEAKDVVALAAVARATTVPATPPPRSLMVTACSPLSGKRGPGPPSWASAGSSGGRSSSSLQAAKKAREITPSSERWHALTSSERWHAIFWEAEGNEGPNPWPIPNSHGPVIPRYSSLGRQLGVMK